MADRPSARDPLKDGGRYPIDGSIWSPDGNWIVFAKNDGGAFRLFRKRSSGGAEELLPGIDKGYVPVGGKQLPSDWSSDGRDVLFEEGGDIWTIAVTDSGETADLGVRTCT